jgi:tripartite ATP-independent transporter DctM subunit
MMDPFWIGILSIALLFIFLALGVPIAFALGLSGVMALVAMRGFGTALNFMLSSPYSTISSWALVIIPLFMVMGHMAFHSGVTTDAYELGHKWLGRVNGGLAMATVFGCAAFAATSGSSLATAATMGKIAIPEMRRFGYRLELCVGCVAAGGTLGILIPPSGVLVIYGVITEQSIGKLLIGGFLPGLVSAVIYMSGIYFMARFLRMGGPIPGPTSWRDKIHALGRSAGVLVLFGIVMGGIYSGFFTAVEAAGFGAAAALLMLLIRSKKRLSDIRDSMKVTAKSTCMILTIFVGAAAFALDLTIAGIPQKLAAYLISLDVPPKLTILILLIPYIPLGMFLDPVSMMVLTLPIIFPVVEALGFSGIWFGILVTKLIEISLITPPVGLNLYVVKSTLPEVSLGRILIGCVPFLIMDFITLGIILFFPEITLFLPNMMM